MKTVRVFIGCALSVHAFFILAAFALGSLSEPNIAIRTVEMVVAASFGCLGIGYALAEAIRKE